MKKNYFKKAMYYLIHPLLIKYKMAEKGYIYMDDAHFLGKQFKIKMGYKMDFSNPKTFDEKLNWLKLHDRNPLYVKLVDKFEVKKYVENVLGSEYIIPTLGIYDNFEQIDFDNLPNQFVLKATHDSGGIYIVKNKSQLDIDDARKILTTSLKRNFFYACREWPYKDVQPRIIVEQYMEDEKTKELRDYKFYCFNGKVHAVLVAANRQNRDHELTFDYYDNNFMKLNLTNHWHPNSNENIDKPVSFDKMVKLASEMSEGFPHVRIDFYEVNGKIYFGEYTFYDMGGYLILSPDSWSQEWGDLIDLSLAYEYKENQSL